MIALLVATTIALGLIGGVALLGVAAKKRRERLELALEPTCLLCASRDVELFVPPDYCCRACSFDTRRAGALSHELETFRALDFALTDLDQAEKLLRNAILANEHALESGEQPFGGSADDIASLLMDAQSYLRDIVLDEPSLLDVPAIEIDRESHQELARYRDDVQLVRDGTRHVILAQMSADGAVDRATLDFEHVVDRDYEGL